MCKRCGAGNGFTLIELLVVISIIGVLSTIAMTSLNGARMKAKDTSIMQSANSLMKSALVDAALSQDYSAYRFYNWPPTVWDCNSYFGSTSDPAGARAACRSMVGNGAYIWASTWGGNHPKFSIMVYLPGAQKYYCVGSNGGSSASTSSGSTSGAGCGGGTNSWSCPGCAGDKNAG